MELCWGVQLTLGDQHSFSNTCRSIVYQDAAEAAYLVLKTHELRGVRFLRGAVLGVFLETLIVLFTAIRHPY